MQEPAIPFNEATRLETLRSLEILDTPPEERFDRVTRLAQRLFDVRFALVTLLDSDRQWFKSSIGFDAIETPRSISFCAHAILQEDVLIVHDARRDERFADNPLVTGEPHIRFYAGCPLSAPDGTRVGTLCLIDDRPREFYDADIVALHDFAAMAQAELAAPPFDSIDELTQLANRRGFEALADIALTWCRRRKRPATLLEFELERYHAIKATLGYAHGNRLLGAFAFNLKNSFRESDVLARVAENQFAVLTIDCGLRAVATLCNRLEESVEKYNHRAQPGTGISFSVGIARFDTDGDDDIGGLMTLAGAEVFRCREARSHSPRRGLVSAGHN